jgi:hypothetical protein
MFNIFKQWLNGSSVIQGTPSVQPNPSSVAEIKYYKGHEVSYHQPLNAYSDKLMTIAPVGFSEQNPTQIKWNTPPTAQVVKTPEIRTSNAPKGRDCK